MEYNDPVAYNKRKTSCNNLIFSNLNERLAHKTIIKTNTSPDMSVPSHAKSLK